MNFRLRLNIHTPILVLLDNAVTECVGLLGNFAVNTERIFPGGKKRFYLMENPRAKDRKGEKGGRQRGRY